MSYKHELMKMPPYFAKMAPLHSFVRPRVAKFDPKVGSRRTTKITNLVVLVIILAVLIFGTLLYMYVVLALILWFLLVRETGIMSENISMC